MKVIVDSRESDRVQLAIDRWDAEVQELETGDYLFEDKVVFEYKKIADLCSSLRDNRVFNQSLSQRLEFPYHFVIVELDKNFDWKKQRRYNRVSKKQVRSALARLNTYTTVIPVTGSTSDCFDWMELQAGKCLDERFLHKYPEIKTMNAAMNFLCNDVRGIGAGKAELISGELGLESLSDLLSLTVQDLTGVKGIGRKTAELIISSIKGGVNNE